MHLQLNNFPCFLDRIESCTYSQHADRDYAVCEQDIIYNLTKNKKIGLNINLIFIVLQKKYTDKLLVYY